MDNYIWAIIIVIAILMAIVGYIADKTDFGRKEFERKVREPKAKKEKINKEIEEVLPVVDEVAVPTEIPSEENNSLENSNFSDLMVDDSTDMAVIDNMYSENSGEPAPELNQVEITTLNDTTNVATENEEIDQSLFEPLPSIDQVFSEPVGASVDTVEPSNEVLENAEVETPVEVPAEDDVWKF